MRDHLYNKHLVRELVLPPKRVMAPLLDSLDNIVHKQFHNVRNEPRDPADLEKALDPLPAPMSDP